MEAEAARAAAELRAAEEALRVSERAAALAALLGDADPSGDGAVSYSEFLRYALRDALAASNTRVMDYFKKMDTSNDGAVDISEFRKAMPALGLEVPVKEIDDLFDEWDPDGSGSLELKELNKICNMHACKIDSQPLQHFCHLLSFAIPSAPRAAWLDAPAFSCGCFLSDVID